MPRERNINGEGTRPSRGKGGRPGQESRHSHRVPTPGDRCGFALWRPPRSDHAGRGRQGWRSRRRSGRCPPQGRWCRCRWCRAQAARARPRSTGQASRPGCQPRDAGARAPLWPPASRRFPANPRAGLEQPKANLVAPNARIKAQHVVGERREFTDQFCADQSAADHDNRQTRATLRRVRVFEAFNQVVSEASASAIVLNVKAFDEPGISRSFVDAPSATTR